MGTLNLDEIEQSVSGQLEVVQKTKELQKVVNRVFPGYQVTLTKEGEGRDVRIPRVVTPRPEFSELSGIDQIRRVLTENGEAMKLRDLHTKLVASGGSMSLQTLSSLLSKYQAEDKFRRFGHALWGLPDQMGSPDEIL